MQSASDVLAGGGELGERMRAIDWSQTALGPVESWPQSLRTCIRIILTSSQPMFVWWGDQLINLYNDAYISIVGGKHPWALARPAADVWREIWDDVGPRAARAMRDNQGTFDEALLLIMERHGYREETYYTFSYSPVPGDHGGPGGILCANSSDTQRIFGERQQALLSEVSARTVDARTPQEACERAVQALALDARDIPFGVLYLVGSDGTATAASAVGIELGHPLVGMLADGIDLTRSNPLHVRPLPIADAPRGPWPEAPRSTITLPIFGADRAPAGALVVAQNPFRVLDDGYRRFLELVGAQISSSLANAQAYDAERKRAETLAELDRAKTTFFSNISHEFRTPLTLMLGPTEDALRSPQRALTGEALESVHRNELRLLKLVNALLDFSRIEAGRVQTAFEPTDLGQLTRDLASSFRSAMERARLRFDIDTGAFTDPVFVDRGMWEKIVLNLLSNALKFTFEGGITVALRDRGDTAELTVTDTGTGIPAEELPRLFERFYRVEGAKSRTHEGSGIGLALTHELVRLHGGSIDVTSAIPGGTTFTVRIPKGKAHLPADNVGAQARAATTATRAAYLEEALRWNSDEPKLTIAVEGDAHVLIADDNADMREYLQRLLGERWKVTVAVDGQDALERARIDRPDLILTDVMMPRLDGFALLRALRREPALASVPVVMLSARAGEEARIEGIEAGADDYLIKPFSARELIARVTNMLQLAGLRREIEDERNRLTSFIEQIPVGVVVWEGPELRCRLRNAEYERMMRRPITPGRRMVDMIPEVLRAGTVDRMTTVMNQGIAIDSAEVKVALDDENGTPIERYFASSLRPIRDRDGTITGVIAASADITGQVTARQAVEQSRAAAEAANRAKDEFLAMLGHELRNPLAPILTALELMRLRGERVLERERAVIERQTQHLSTLVEDLLDVSRITRGVVTLKREHIVIGDLLTKALETASPLFEQQRHEIIVECAAGLTVDADAARLTQVFANLLTNAAKYTDPGGRITVSAGRDGDDIVVRVVDTGRGIAADMLPRVFDLFVQEHQNLDRSRGGLGLGLAIVKSLVELHGGRVEATSGGKGAGSTFVVRLPAAVAMTSATAAPSTSANRSTGGISVLVVDDNIDAASLLSDLLKLRGYSTRVAYDAPQALALANEYIPDVALLDIGLPAMDGYELARRLRALPGWRNVRLLAVTGYGQSSDRQRSKDAGFDHHLVKPIDVESLQKLLPREPLS